MGFTCVVGSRFIKKKTLVSSRQYGTRILERDNTAEWLDFCGRCTNLLWYKFTFSISQVLAVFRKEFQCSK